MPFHLSEEQEMIRRVVSELREKTVAPASKEVDRERRAPREALEGLTELGLFGMLTTEEHGGAGADTVTFCLALEELAKGCASTAALMGVTNALGVLPLHQLGTDEQKQRFLDPVAQGDETIAFALTEPNAGADVTDLDTKLVPQQGDEYLLRGQKAWTIAAPLADTFIVPARGPQGATIAIVPADRDGVESGPPERLLGLHGTKTGPLYLDDVTVSAEEILGEEGGGLPQLQEPMRVSRLAVAACATGLMEASLEKSLDFADQREQFDQPIKEFQETQNRLAGLRVGATTARQLTYAAADKRDRQEPFSSMASQAKWYATQTAQEETRSAIRLHGGTGYMRDSPVERYYRDARTLKILGGPNQLHRQRIVDAMY